jgi:hypothetical protein
MEPLEIAQLRSEMDCRVVAEYYYPDDPSYNYIVRQYGLNGEWCDEYEGEVNSGSGIGADYAVYISDNLDEVVADAKDYLEHLIEMDFTEAEVVHKEQIGAYLAEYEKHNSFYIANIRKGRYLVEAFAGSSVEELQHKVRHYLKNKGE